jgi:multiple antibiotic resistance protein
MASWSLAFPTIVTPFGIAVLVVTLRLRPGDLATGEILGLAAVVLILDLLAMVFADHILRAPFVSSALLILGSVMIVLQVALGIEVMLYALRLLGVV